jgi:hypothetical protein
MVFGDVDITISPRNDCMDLTIGLKNSKIAHGVANHKLTSLFTFIWQTLK